MLNRITIMGRLTRDPELRYTKTEKPVASFTLAVDRDGKDAGVDFIDCVAWDRSATFVSTYFAKGSLAAVDGRLQFRDWTDQTGMKRRTAEVIANSVYFAEVKRKTETNDVAPAASTFSALSEADGELPWV